MASFLTHRIPNPPPSVLAVKRPFSLSHSPVHWLGWLIYIDRRSDLSCSCSDLRWIPPAEFSSSRDSPRAQPLSLTSLYNQISSKVLLKNEPYERAKDWIDNDRVAALKRQTHDQELDRCRHRRLWSHWMEGPPLLFISEGFRNCHLRRRTSPLLHHPPLQVYPRVQHEHGIFRLGNPLCCLGLDGINVRRIFERLVFPHSRCSYPHLSWQVYLLNRGNVWRCRSQPACTGCNGAVKYGEWNGRRKRRELSLGPTRRSWYSGVCGHFKGWLTERMNLDSTECWWSI